MTLLAEAGQGIDIAEFCGGEARTTTVAIRRRLRGGRNFDLVTHIDLGDPQTQKKALEYLDTHDVLVLVMGPQCRTLGPTSNLNASINYDTWLEHYKEDMPHVRYCGRAAIHQLKKGRHFIAENPYPTWLVEEPGWKELLQDHRVKTTVIDQCMLGQHIDGVKVKKPTLLIASADKLLNHSAGAGATGVTNTPAPSAEGRHYTVCKPGRGSSQKGSWRALCVLSED